MTLVKILAFSDNDTTADAEKVNAAMMKEQNVSQYLFVGDGPYAKSGTKWVTMMKKSFDDTKVKDLIFSQGNHEHIESESKQTQTDIEAWIPSLKTNAWRSAKQVGNTYIISMNTQDMDIEFKRDQFTYITGELQKAKQLRASGQIDWIIVLFHKPFFTLKSSHSPYTAVRFLYKEAFRDAQVDFCLSGHNHNTQLWLPMIPSDSAANGEGTQLFTYTSDGKTFDFAKDHGAAFIVTGHAGHEWNPIKDQKNVNVMHYRDSGKFGYTSLEFDGKKAKVMSKDTDNAVTFEYAVTREGGTIPPPPPDTTPEPCPPNQHRDTTTGQCVPNDIEPVCPSGQHFDVVLKQCVPDSNPPPIVCPKDYHYDPSLGKCIPDLEPPINPICPINYHWDSEKGYCVLNDGTPPPSCPAGQHWSPEKMQCVPDVIIPPECPPKTHWDSAQNKCVPDDDGTPPPNPPPNPPPTPSGDVLYDSNIHLKTGKSFTVTDTYGDQKPDGKGLFMAASGKPRLKVDPNGEFHLEADPGHGRVYIKALNYNSKLSGEINIESDAIDSCTLRLRSRHNMGGDCENRFGGFGTSIYQKEGTVEFKTESCHNLHENSISGKPPQTMKIGQWYPFEYSCSNAQDSKSVNFSLKIDYGQGLVKVLEGSHKSPKPFFMDEATFKKESYIWLRINNASKTASVGFRNVKLVKI